MAKNLTENAVRGLAREALGLVDSDIACAGVGQIATFNQLGFPGAADKPDGWYPPNNKNEAAVVLETKAARISPGKAPIDEVLKTCALFGCIMNAYMRAKMTCAEGDSAAVQSAFETV